MNHQNLTETSPNSKNGRALCLCILETPGMESQKIVNILTSLCHTSADKKLETGTLTFMTNTLMRKQRSGKSHGNNSKMS